MTTNRDSVIPPFDRVGGEVLNIRTNSRFMRAILFDKYEGRDCITIYMAGYYAEASVIHCYDTEATIWRGILIAQSIDHTQGDQS